MNRSKYLICALALIGFAALAKTDWQLSFHSPQ